MRSLFYKLTIVFLVITGVLKAQDDFPEKPNPPRLVNDFAGMLSPGEVQALEEKLVRYYDTTSNQIAIVTLADLKGYEISDYAFGLGQKWGIGIKGRDNGILILVKPKTAESGGKIFIATGYGAEGAVPDGIIRPIIDNEILPRFRNGEIYAGLDAATTVIFQLMKGEYSWTDYKGKRPGEAAPGSAIAAGLLILFVFIVFVIMGIRQSKRAHTLSGSSIPWWIWAGMMSSRGSGRSSSNWGSFSSGSGMFGGSRGGGGFGGFGGGSFGGGGAGGSW